MTEERRFALIIANNEYSDPDLQRLNAPAQDAKALAKVLKDPTIGGFEEVKILMNEPTSNIMEAISDLFDNRKREDLLLLYFSCHGIKDENGKLYFATPNTRRKKLRLTAVSADFINQEMFVSRSRKQVLILDCCYGGAFARGMLPKADKNVYAIEHFKGQERARSVISSTHSIFYK
jgi:uncharacterized caspase-like protein